MGGSTPPAAFLSALEFGVPLSQDEIRAVDAAQDAPARSFPVFCHLNADWNAEPNAPDPKVSLEGSRLQLKFLLNSFAYYAEDGEIGRLTFEGVTAWRLGETNDEGWYMGKCRYSRLAPTWGEFYEILGDDDLRDQPQDWQVLSPVTAGRHFLFYLRDETFECIAQDWRFDRESTLD